MFSPSVSQLLLTAIGHDDGGLESTGLSGDLDQFPLIYLLGIKHRSQVDLLVLWIPHTEAEFKSSPVLLDLDVLLLPGQQLNHTEIDFPS